MNNDSTRKSAIALAIWSTLAVIALLTSSLLKFLPSLPSGISVSHLIALVAGILAGTELVVLASFMILRYRDRPSVEGAMLGKIYHMVAGGAVLLTLAYGFGQAKSFGQFFALFGGMILGWSLQAPVSGFAAWIMVSLKRPFRPGDRIQFPNLGLTGDVHEIGPMYTMLDQVGGTIGGEEAVGRYILVPNPLLFSQVVINYTVTQESPYMLDEVIVRITYDSDWLRAEEILLKAARQITGDIIQTTGVEPYIRADSYDYGMNLRLRYQTRVQERAEIQYEINKLIFLELQGNRSVDLAIPYVYSSWSGTNQKEAGPGVASTLTVQDIAMSQIHQPDVHDNGEAITALTKSIVMHGLLQPIVVSRAADGGFIILSGTKRFAACRALGWKTIPATVREPAAATPGSAADSRLTASGITSEIIEHPEIIEHSEAKTTVGKPANITPELN